MASSEVGFYIFCAILAFILLFIPLLWQIRRSNIAAALLVFWLQTSIFFAILNAILWPTPSSIITGYNGDIFCDFVAKWRIASDTGGINSSVMCMMITIYRMFWGVGMYRESRRSKQIRIVYEWGLALVFPLGLAATHYVVQPNRYYLHPVTGCVPPIDNSWASLMVMGWPLAFSTVSLVLCG